MATVSSESLWTAHDVANFLKCSLSFVHKASADGRLPCLRIGAMLRFDPEVVRTFVYGGKQKPRRSVA